MGRFLTGSRVVKTLRDEQPHALYTSLMNNFYAEQRKPGLVFFFNDAKKKPCSRMSTKLTQKYERSKNTMA